MHKLTVLIVGSNDYNPKEIEVLAGDEGANGAFRPVGKCTLTNRLLFETRYQECELAPTTARYCEAQVCVVVSFQRVGGVRNSCGLRGAYANSEHSFGQIAKIS